MANGKKKVPTISIEISPGEAYDRLAILFLKRSRIRDPAKRKRVIDEIHAQRLANKLMRIQHPAPAGVLELQEQLDPIHGELWDVENRLRECEAKQDFGPFFMRGARRVYQLNDKRARVKNQIDALYGCEGEVKEYFYG